MGITTVERRIKNVPENKPPSKREGALREAAARVYRRYGNDLTAFRRDIQREKELEKRAR